MEVAFNNEARYKYLTKKAKALAIQFMVRGILAVVHYILVGS